MRILSQAWPKWYTNELLQVAGKRVGITEYGLNVNWMQQKMFDRAEQLMAESPEKKDLNLSVSSPIGVRKFSRDYYRLKYAAAEEMLNEHRNLDAADVPGLLSIKTVTPKVKATKNIRLTQMYGSMTGKDALKMAAEVQAKKQEVEDKKTASVAKRVLQIVKDQVEDVQHQTLESAPCAKEYFCRNVLS